MGSGLDTLRRSVGQIPAPPPGSRRTRMGRDIRPAYLSPRQAGNFLGFHNYAFGPPPSAEGYIGSPPERVHLESKCFSRKRARQDRTFKLGSSPRHAASAPIGAALNSNPRPPRGTAKRLLVSDAKSGEDLKLG